MSGHTCNMSGNSGVASAKPTPVDFSTAKAKPGESVRVSTMRRQFAMLKDTFARSLVHDAAVRERNVPNTRPQGLARTSLTKEDRG